MISIFNFIKDKLYYLITGYMTKMGMIAWGGEIYNGPVPWDPSTWDGGSFQGASGDSSGTFVSAADQAAAAQEAPAWLAPQDYATYGYTPEGQSTQLPAAIPQYNPSQLSANPDPTQVFNFVANPNVTANNPFASSINNAYQSLLGRPATAAEIASNSQMLQQKPDDYGIFLNNLASSPEAAAAYAAGKQNLIGGTPARIDPTGENSQPAVDSLSNTLSWLSSSYPNYTPTQENGIQKVTNAIGSAIPYAALGVMTGGLADALLAPSAGSLIASGGLDLGTGFTGSGFGAGAPLAASGGLDLGTGFTGAGYDVGGSLAASGGLDLGTGFTSSAGAPSFELGAPAINPAEWPGVSSADLGTTATNVPSSSVINPTDWPGVSSADLGTTATNVASDSIPSAIDAATGLTAAELANYARMGLTGAALAKFLAGVAGIGGSSGSSGSSSGGTNGSKTTTNPLASLLRNPIAGYSNQSAPGGLYKGNTNPFMFAKEQPIQNARQSYDPFAALNVAQTPPQSNNNLMANLLREHIYG